MLGITLFVLSVQDIKHKSLGAASLLIFFTASLVNGIITDKFTAADMISGIIFVSLLGAVSIVTKCIGMGDVAVSAIIVCLKGTIFSISVFTFAMTLLGIFNSVRIIGGRLSKKYTAPFVPYMGICAAVIMFFA